uniref:RNase H domain-containing protein n=3 Tax=Macrostomum lignano TaxID=282301 RepID=A0A1I8HC06_9PLAT
MIPRMMQHSRITKATAATMTAVLMGSDMPRPDKPSGSWSSGHSSTGQAPPEIPPGEAASRIGAVVGLERTRRWPRVPQHDGLQVEAGVTAGLGVGVRKELAVGEAAEQLHLRGADVIAHQQAVLPAGLWVMCGPSTSAEFAAASGSTADEFSSRSRTARVPLTARCPRGWQVSITGAVVVKVSGGGAKMMSKVPTAECGAYSSTGFSSIIVGPSLQHPTEQRATDLHSRSDSHNPRNFFGPPGRLLKFQPVCAGFRVPHQGGQESLHICAQLQLLCFGAINADQPAGRAQVGCQSSSPSETHPPWRQKVSSCQPRKLPRPIAAAPQTAQDAACTTLLLLLPHPPNKPGSLARGRCRRPRRVKKPRPRKRTADFPGSGLHFLRLLLHPPSSPRQSGPLHLASPPPHRCYIVASGGSQLCCFFFHLRLRGGEMGHREVQQNIGCRRLSARAQQQSLAAACGSWQLASSVVLFFRRASWKNLENPQQGRQIASTLDSRPEPAIIKEHGTDLPRAEVPAVSWLVGRLRPLLQQQQQQQNGRPPRPLSRTREAPQVEKEKRSETRTAKGGREGRQRFEAFDSPLRYPPPYPAPRDPGDQNTARVPSDCVLAQRPLLAGRQCRPVSQKIRLLLREEAHAAQREDAVKEQAAAEDEPEAAKPPYSLGPELILGVALTQTQLESPNQSTFRGCFSQAWGCQSVCACTTPDCTLSGADICKARHRFCYSRVRVAAVSEPQLIEKGCIGGWRAERDCRHSMVSLVDADTYQVCCSGPWCNGAPLERIPQLRVTTRSLPASTEATASPPQSAVAGADRLSSQQVSSVVSLSAAASAAPTASESAAARDAASPTTEPFASVGGRGSQEPLSVLRQATPWPSQPVRRSPGGYPLDAGVSDLVHPVYIAVPVMSLCLIVTALAALVLVIRRREQLEGPPEQSQQQRQQRGEPQQYSMYFRNSLLSPEPRRSQQGHLLSWCQQPEPPPQQPQQPQCRRPLLSCNGRRPSTSNSEPFPFPLKDTEEPCWLSRRPSGGQPTTLGAAFAKTKAGAGSKLTKVSGIKPSWNPSRFCIAHAGNRTESETSPGLRESRIGNDPPETRRSATEDTIKSWGDRKIHYFTDGSASEGTENGGAACVAVAPTSGQVIWIEGAATGRWCSSFQAELSALHLALDHILETKQDSALILTDSQSAIAALKDKDHFLECPALAGARHATDLHQLEDLADGDLVASGGASDGAPKRQRKNKVRPIVWCRAPQRHSGCSPRMKLLWVSVYLLVQLLLCFGSASARRIAVLAQTGSADRSLVEAAVSKLVNGHWVFPLFKTEPLNFEWLQVADALEAVQRGLSLASTSNATSFLEAAAAVLQRVAAPVAAVLHDEFQDHKLVEELQLELSAKGIASSTFQINNSVGNLNLTLTNMIKAKIRNIVVLCDPGTVLNIVNLAQKTGTLQPNYFWTVIDTGVRLASIEDLLPANESANILVIRESAIDLKTASAGCTSQLKTVFPDCQTSRYSMLELKAVEAVLSFASATHSLLDSSGLPASNVSCRPLQPWSAGPALAAQLKQLRQPLSAGSSWTPSDYFLEVQATFHDEFSDPVRFVNSGRFFVGNGSLEVSFRYRGRSLIFPNTFIDFKNRTLRSRPYMQYSNGTVGIPGAISTDIIHFLSLHLNYS